MAKMKYTVEKVLYFANQRSGIHVAPFEKERDTDLHRIVEALIEKGDIHLVGTDDSGDYYQTTKSGDIHLLKLQISWRRAHGKDTSEHEASLARLTA